jgi:predicted MFS family arabinose efflux permease
MAGRIVDPLVTAIAADFAAPVAVVALLASAYTMPFSFSQPLLGPLGDALGKSLLIRISVAILALCLLACALAPSLGSLFVFRVLAGIAGAGILPISFALIGDSFALAVRQVALSRFLGATLIGQLVGASAAGIIAEMIGWRGVLGLCALLACVAAIVAAFWLPRSQQPAQAFNLAEAISRYRLVLSNPRSFVCFSAVCLEGAAIYGVTPFIGNLMQENQLGGLREAGFAIAGLGFGGLMYTVMVPVILKFATRPQMMRAGGILAGLALMSLGLTISWIWTGVSMIMLGIGFFLMHNSIQTEVTELAPSARASGFALHAFSFYMGQSVGPMLYAVSIHAIGFNTSVIIGGVVLIAVGIGANILIRRLVPKTL